MGPASRQPDRERASPFGPALGLDRAAVEPDQLLRERKPDSRARLRARGTAAPMEAVEDPRKVLLRDAGAVVHDLGDERPRLVRIPLRTDAHRDVASRGRELLRVADDVVEDLLKVLRIESERQRRIRTLDRQRDALARGERSEGADDPAQEQAVVTATRAQGEPARLRARDVEELVHEPQEAMRASRRDIDLIAGVLGQRTVKAFLQVLKRTLDE